MSGAAAGRGAKLVLTGLKSQAPKERLCCHQRPSFPPLVKGGWGGGEPDSLASPGVDRRTSALSVSRRSAVATSGNDTTSRPAGPRGPPSRPHRWSRHNPLVHWAVHGPPPRGPPFTRGGKEGGLAEFRNEFGKSTERCNPNFAPRRCRRVAAHTAVFENQSKHLQCVSCTRSLARLATNATQVNF